MSWSRAEYVDKVEAELRDYRVRYLVVASEIAHALGRDQAWAQDLYDRLAVDPTSAPASLREYMNYRHRCAMDIERLAGGFRTDLEQNHVGR